MFVGEEDAAWLASLTPDAVKDKQSAVKQPARKCTEALRIVLR